MRRESSGVIILLATATVCIAPGALADSLSYRHGYFPSTTDFVTDRPGLLITEPYVASLLPAGAVVALLTFRPARGMAAGMLFAADLTGCLLE